MLYITRACRCRAHSYAHVHPPFEPWDTGPIKPETPKQQIEKEENPTMSPTSHYEPKEWGNPPEGLQPATLKEVRDTVGRNFSTGGPSPQKQLIWKLDALGQNGQPLKIFQWCNDSFHPKSKLRAVATALLGHDPGNKLDWDDLLGHRPDPDQVHPGRERLHRRPGGRRGERAARSRAQGAGTCVPATPATVTPACG
jgi:hypothetical protein